MFEARPGLVNRATGFRSMLGQFVSSTAARVTALAWQLAVPGVCALCDGPCQWQRCRGGLDLCVHCEGAMPARRSPQILADSGLQVFAPYAYRPPADFMVRQLKFRGQRGHARTLGVLLAEARAAWPAALPSLLVPVPLHWQRLRERGFNQAGEIARFAGRRLHIPVEPRALHRVRETGAQSQLAATARAANVRDCFTTARRFAPGVRVALVDDVLTTGSTAMEAARCLRAAGAAEVEIWVACRAGNVIKKAAVLANRRPDQPLGSETQKVSFTPP
jgi:ComF family protein